MRFSDAFPSKYLKAADLAGKEYELIIKSIYMEDISAGDDSPVMKPVMRLQSKTGGEMEKGIVLNKTNGLVLSTAYGDETDEWIGKPVCVYPTKVQFKGELVDAIRMRIPTPAAADDEEPPF